MKKESIVLALIFFAAVFFSGCSATVELHARSDKNCDISETFDIGDVLFEKIKNLSSNAGSFLGENGEVPATKEITRKFNSSQIDDQRKFQKFVEVTDNSIKVTFSPEAIRALVSSLDEESRYYLDLFMAPVFTGEKMTVEEYRDTVALVYGEDVARESETAFVKLVLVSADGRRRRTVKIPALKLLVLDETMEYSLNW